MEPRQYGQHRTEDAPTEVEVWLGPKDGHPVILRTTRPVDPSILRQRANINAAAYAKGQGHL